MIKFRREAFFEIHNSQFTIVVEIPTEFLRL